MTPRARRVVRAAKIGTAAVAVILSPLPLADELLLAPALLGVAAVVCQERGLALADVPWSTLTRTAVAGLAARAAVNLATSYLPGVAAVANAATALALMHAYADWADRCAMKLRSPAPT